MRHVFALSIASSDGLQSSLEVLRVCVGLVAGVVGGFGDPVLVLGACFGVERTVVMGQEQFVLVGNVFVVASSSPDGIAVECGVGVGVMVVVGMVVRVLAVA